MCHWFRFFVFVHELDKIHFFDFFSYLYFSIFVQYINVCIICDVYEDLGKSNMFEFLHKLHF